jgi:large subunit ribosomal protein L24
MNKIRKGDQVILNTGKDKGKQGTVIGILDSGHVVVEGLNLVKKHAKANPMKGIAGGIIAKEMPLDISNVALFNSTAALPSNLTNEPSGRRTPLAVRTTTAL